MENLKGNAGRMSEVRNELEQMKKLNEELYQSYGELETKLNSILRPIPSSPTCETEKEIALVPLARELKEENSKITGMIHSLNSLRERLEI